MHRLDNLYALKFESLESASLLAVKMSDTNENFSAEDNISVSGTAIYDEVLSRRRRRKKFTPTQKAPTAHIRKTGACTECRARKVRVCWPPMDLIVVILYSRVRC
jgi:hypothetical protein